MIDCSHRYLIKDNASGEYIGSTDNLGIILASGQCLVDTIGADGLGTRDGRRGIAQFLRRQTTENPA